MALFFGNGKGCCLLFPDVIDHRSFDHDACLCLLTLVCSCRVASSMFFLAVPSYNHRRNLECVARTNIRVRKFQGQSNPLASRQGQDSWKRQCHRRRISKQCRNQSSLSAIDVNRSDRKSIRVSLLVSQSICASVSQSVNQSVVIICVWTGGRYGCEHDSLHEVQRDSPVMG